MIDFTHFVSSANSRTIEDDTSSESNCNCNCLLSVCELEAGMLS